MARRGNRYGYGSYRGRNRGRTALKIVIAVLSVVLLLVLGLFFLQERGLVFTSDGPRLQLPFGAMATPAPSPEESEPLVVRTPPPAPTPTPKPALRALLLPRSALSDGTAESLLSGEGANAAVFDMKADDGSLGYVSALETAKQAGASAADPALNEAIRAFTAGETYAVARVSCFRDNKAPYAMPALGVKTRSGYNWRDSGDLRWLSPASAEARQYVTDVCLELAGLGFDEILLDNSGYPTQGKLERIRRGDAYTPGQLDLVVDGFYAQVQEALAGAYPEVVLSIRTDGETMAAGENETSGQRVETIVRCAGRIWADDLTGTGWESALQTLRNAGGEEKDLVAVGTEWPAGAWDAARLTIPAAAE